MVPLVNQLQPVLFLHYRRYLSGQKKAYLLSKLTGLFVVGAIFCCLGFLLYFRCRKKSYYVITLALAVAIWAAFRFALGVDF